MWSSLAHHKVQKSKSNIGHFPPYSVICLQTAPLGAVFYPFL
ncbi:Uncharacterised protein [Vibrio cholerae]|nr:Uncharacterised protein [Vibrio cholerae]